MPGQSQIRSKILHKGLALVIVPCLVDGIFCWQLSEVLARKEELAQSDRKQNLILQHSVSILMQYGTTTTAVANSFFGPGGQMPDETKGRLLKLRDEFNELEKLTSDDPELHRQILAMHQTSQDQLTKFESLEKQSGPAERNIVSFISRLQSGGMIEMFRKAGTNSERVMNMVRGQQIRLDEIRKREAEQQQQLKNLIAYGVIGNFVLALAIGLWFLRNITARLSVLVDNAQRLPKGVELNKRVAGNDELSYLDGALHDAARDLKSASEHRQYLMQMVAHDLRSPLMSAQVALNILVDDRLGELPELAKRQIESLKRNISRLTNLTNDLLTIDKLEAGKLDIAATDLSVADVVDEAISSLADLAKQKKIDLVNECSGFYMKADRGRILQVLTNLISNAIKFAPAETPVVIACSAQNDQVRISVKDSGPGIPESDRETIFSKFYQLNNGTGKGFGLGLAICKLIVEAQNGKISVTSEPGNGSTFWFTLPQSTAAEAFLSQQQLRTIPVSKETA